MRLFLSGLAALAVCVCGSSTCGAGDRGGHPSPYYRPPSEVRFGGVLEESYNYHRLRSTTIPAETTSPLPFPRGGGKSIEPSSGWYGYGFPVQTYRWGWFGAEHYYPTVWWHHGYYGDCRRHAYRRGY